MLFRNILRILSNLRYAGRLAWVAAFSTVLMEGILLILPKLGERVIHSVEIRAEYSTVLYWAGILAGVSVVYVVSTAVKWRLWDYLWGKVFVAKTLEYKKRLLAINYATLLEHGSGKLISRFSRGIDAEVDFMYHTVDMLLSGGVRLAAVLVIIGLFSPWLSLGFLVFLVTVVAIQMGISRLIAPLAQTLEKTMEDDKRNLARIVTENFLIRTSGRTRYELGRADGILSGYAMGNLRYEASAWGIFHVLELGFRWAEAGAFALLGWYALGGTLPLSTIPMMGTYIWLAWDPISNFLNHLRTMSRGYETYLRMREVLDTPDIYADGTVDYVYRKGHISISGASF